MTSPENAEFDDFLRGPPAPPGCGCWEYNPCWDEDYGACWWVEPELCSHCHYAFENDDDLEFEG